MPRKARKFTAAIHKLGINPVVDPPQHVLDSVFADAGRSNGPIQVTGLINGFEFVQTLVKYGGMWRLYVNAEMLRGSGLVVGETAEFEIEFDARPREVPVPPQFAEALAAEPAAEEAFSKLPAGRQKEILRYLGSLKTASSLERNIARVLTQLRG